MFTSKPLCSVLTSLIDEGKLKFSRQSPANNFVLICTSLCLFVSLSLVSPEGDVSSYQTLHRTGKPKGNARRRVIFFFSAKTVNKLDGCLQVYTQQSVEDNTAHEWQWSYRIQILHTRKLSTRGSLWNLEVFYKKTSPVTPYFHCFNILL